MIVIQCLCKCSVNFNLFCSPGALIYLLDLFCNCTHPQVRTQTAELFSKMTSDKLVGPKVSLHILQCKVILVCLFFYFHFSFSLLTPLIVFLLAGASNSDPFPSWCLHGCHARQR